MARTCVGLAVSGKSALAVGCGNDRLLEGIEWLQ